MNAISATPTSLLPENGLMTGRSGFPKEAGARRAGNATTNRQQAYPPVTRSSHRAGARNRHEGTTWLNEEEQRHDPGQRLASMFEKAEPALRFGMAVAIVFCWSLNFVGRHPVTGGGPMELANSALEACTLSLIWMAILARAAYISMLQHILSDATSSPAR